MEKIRLLAICLTLIGAVFAGTGTDTDNELKILTEKLPAGKVGMEYKFRLEANTDGVEWSIEGLPEGISSNGDTIYGIPKKEGGYEVEVYASKDKQTADKVFRLTITKDTIIPPPTPEPTPIPQNFGAGAPSRKEVTHGKITIQHFLNLNEKQKETVRAKAYSILRAQINDGQNIDSYTARLLYATELMGRQG